MHKPNEICGEDPFRDEVVEEIERLAMPFEQYGIES